MSKFTSFAVAGGSGKVGRAIVASLVAARAAKVVVLSRSAETSIAGAVIKAVDFDSVDSVKAALDGVDVVVSALSGHALHVQPTLATAAKAAGVKLFLPSEFGIPSREFGPGSFFYPKRQLLDQLKEMGLPSLAITNGAFPELVFTSPIFNLHYPSGKAHIVGSPDTPASYITIPDLGSFVGQLLTSRPADELVQLGEIGVEASNASTAQTIAAFEKSHPGAKVELTTTPLEEAEAELSNKKGMEYFLAWSATLWAKGMVDVTRGGTRPTANHLVPGWRPTTIEEFLAKL